MKLYLVIRMYHITNKGDRLYDIILYPHNGIFGIVNPISDQWATKSDIPPNSARTMASVPHSL